MKVFSCATLLAHSKGCKTIPPLDSVTYSGLGPALPRPVARAKSSLPGQWQKTWGKCKRPGKVLSLGPLVTFKIQKGMFKEL